MKKILFFLLLAGIWGGGLYYYRDVLFAKGCDAPLPYRIGTLDPRFNLSQEALIPILKSAESVWEKASGRDLLAYDPGASLHIDFVFDERQIRSLEEEQLEKKKEVLDEAQKKIEAQYDAFARAYDQKLASYRSQAAEYENRLRKFNRAVSDWNAGDKTSEQAYNKIKKEEKSLKALSAELDREFAALENDARKGQNLSQQEESMVNAYNSQIETFSEKYGPVDEYEQGVYSENAITMYQYRGMDDLTFVLSHELGHALGMDHVSDPRAIMYPVFGEQSLAPIVPQALDREELTAACEYRKGGAIRFWDWLLSR